MIVPTRFSCREERREQIDGLYVQKGASSPAEIAAFY